MEKEQIESKVKEIIATIADCDISDVKEQTNVTEIGLDSLDRMELVMDLERDFNIRVPEDEGEKALTTQDFIDLVENHLTES